MLKHHVRPMSELISWAVNHRPGAPADTLGLHKDTAPNWSDAGLVSAELRDRLRASLDAGEPVAVRVPLRIRENGKPEVRSSFDVFLVRDRSATGPSVQFIRGGLLVSGMTKRLPGMRAVVVAEDPGVAGFLRASENPSHTKWNAKPIKDRFKFAPGTLNYVVDAAKKITELLAGDPAERIRPAASAATTSIWLWRWIRIPCRRTHASSLRPTAG